MILLHSLIGLTKIALEGRNLETEKEPQDEEKEPGGRTGRRQGSQKKNCLLSTQPRWIAHVKNNPVVSLLSFHVLSRFCCSSALNEHMLRSPLPSLSKPCATLRFFVSLPLRLLAIYATSGKATFFDAAASQHGGPWQGKTQSSGVAMCVQVMAC